MSHNQLETGLFSLPVELLIKICSFLMVLDVSIYTLNRPPTMVIRGMPQSNDREQSLSTATAKYNASSQILRLCKLFNQVALPILYGHNTFEADGPFYISRMRDTHSPAAVSCLRKLVIHHDIPSYYADPRFLSQIRRTGLPSFVFQPLSSLSSLRELNIRVHDNAEGSQQVTQCESTLKDVFRDSDSSFTRCCMRSISESCLRVSIEIAYKNHLGDRGFLHRRTPVETMTVVDLSRKKSHNGLDEAWQLTDESEEYVAIVQRHHVDTGAPSEWQVVKRFAVRDLRYIGDNASTDAQEEEECENSNLEWYQKVLDHYESCDTS